MVQRFLFYRIHRKRSGHAIADGKQFAVYVFFGSADTGLSFREDTFERAEKAFNPVGIFIVDFPEERVLVAVGYCAAHLYLVTVNL